MIFWNRAGLARAVRTVWKSSRTTSRAFAIFSFASASTSAIMESSPWFQSSLRCPLGHDGADALAHDGFRHVPGGFHAKDHHGHLVIHAQTERCRIHNLQTLNQRLLIGQLVVLFSARVLLRVLVYTPSTPF